MTGPYRVGDTEARTYGQLIDRSQPVSFRFDGKRYSGLAGDTLASALLANGVRLVARSSRYHRPRGILSAGADEPNALVTIGKGPARTPNIPATMVALREGLSAWSQAGFPGKRLDAGVIAGRVAAAFPADLSYKTFMAPGSNAWTQYARLLRRTGDAGSPPSASARFAANFQADETRCHVLVVGGGVAGLAAAQAAAAAGGSVVLCEATAQFGGLSDLYAKPIDGKTQTEWVAARLASLRTDKNVRLLAAATLVEISDDGTALVAQAPAPESADDTPGTLWRIKAAKILIATGASEQPLVFADNDRPAIMLASAARIYLHRYGVLPGTRGIVFTNNDDAYQTALALHETGLVEMRVIDMRPEPGGEPVMRAMAAGVRMSFASAIAGIETRAGGTRLVAASAGAMGHVDLSRTFERIECDFICMSGGWAGDRMMTAAGQRFSDKVRAIGAANETHDLSALLRESMEAGDRAARETVGAPHHHFDASLQQPELPETAPVVVPRARDKARNRWRFVDFRDDVLEDDIVRAARAGNRTLEQVQRYTRLGLGVDRGRSSLGNAYRILQDAISGGTTQARTAFNRPLAPVSFAALSAWAEKSDSLAANDLPTLPQDGGAQDWHYRAGWRLPLAYRRKGESWAVAAAREVETVHTEVGIIDLSARCLVDVSGNDAAVFLERACTASVQPLSAGTFADGYLLDDLARIVDFARIARLGAARFRIIGSTGRQDVTLAWLRGLQARWRKLSVELTPTTAERAQFAIAGPDANELLKSLRIAAALREENTGREIKTGVVQGRPYEMMLSRVTGVECSEFFVPRQDAQSLWSAFLAKGAVPIGLDALQALRLERGMPMADDILDAGILPPGLGSGFAQPSKKSDFLGKYVLANLPKRRTDAELVGLLTDETAKALDYGAHGTTPKQPEHFISGGYVISSGRSRVLDRPVALALVVQGQRRLGEQMLFSSGREQITATIVDPVFSL